MKCFLFVGAIKRLILLFSYIINKFITTLLYFSYINLGYFSFPP